MTRRDIITFGALTLLIFGVLGVIVLHALGVIDGTCYYDSCR